VASDPNGQTPDIFVRNLSTGVTTLASVAPDGTTGGNDDSYNPSLSADGLKVAFESHASNLVASDNNGRSDIFVRDLSAA
jgi:Tol biopolymer transport system component